MKYDANCKPIIGGLLETFILSRAAIGEFSGKLVSDELTNITSGTWTPSPGTIYPLLAKLVKLGFIKNTKGTGREVSYVITNTGLKAFESKKQMLKEHGETSMSVMFPVFISIMQNLTANQAKDIVSDMDDLKVLKQKLFLMPSEKRKSTISKILKLLK